MSPIKVFKPKTLRSPQLRKKKRKALAVRAGMVLAALALLVALASFASKMDSFEIAKVEPVGNSVVTGDEIAQVVDSVIGGNYLKLFSRRNVFLYPQEEVERALAERYPILASVAVGANGFRSVKVEVAERSPSALWCVFDPGAAQPFTDHCHFLDPAGYAYSDAPEFKGNAYFKFYRSVEGDIVGQSFAPSEAYASYLKFAEGVKSLGLAPSYVYVKQDGDLDVYLRSGGRILASGREDADGALANLATILEDEGSKGALDYIDLRYGNKIFYKMR